MKVSSNVLGWRLFCIRLAVSYGDLIDINSGTFSGTQMKLEQLKLEATQNIGLCRRSKPKERARKDVSQKASWCKFEFISKPCRGPSGQAHSSPCKSLVA